MWKQLLGIIGVTTVIAGAIGTLTWFIITHFLNRRIESFKADLSKQAEEFKVDLERKTERFKTELDKMALEHEVQFRRIDEKVADALSEMYERIHRLQTAVGSFISPVEWGGEPTKEEKHKIAQEASQLLNECLIKKRLYLPPEIYEKTMTLANKLSDIANDFASRYGRREVGEIDCWTKPWNEMKAEAKPLFDEIATVFQKRIGVV